VSAGDEIFRRIQSVARASAAHSGTGAPTQEYLIRHTLESFLDRLTRTSHADDFVCCGCWFLSWRNENSGVVPRLENDGDDRVARKVDDVWPFRKIRCQPDLRRISSTLIVD